MSIGEHDLLTLPHQFVHHFLPIFYRLPPDLFNALMQCAISSLSLQERYSLTSSCTFLVRSANIRVAVATKANFPLERNHQPHGYK